MKTKIIANYLPQYHSIPENDMWWGEGYTDWVAVKNSKPLFKGHQQPNIPLNKNYYDLSKMEAVKWQAEIARKHGIYGFGIYHYWFNSNMHLLDKPVQIIRDNIDIDINYMFIWDNSTWKRTWSNVEFSNDWAPLYENNTSKEKNGILAELIYGDEADWKIHFEYLLEYFNDARYIKVNNRPVFAIYNQNCNPETLIKMCKYWNNLAKEHGFEGIYILGKINNKNINITDYIFKYEPEWSGWMWHNQLERVMNRFNLLVCKIAKKPTLYQYDKIYKKIIKDAKANNYKNMQYSCFVDYDDTPRRGVNGKIVKGASPVKFKKYILELLKICEKQKKEFLFITAWNEWGEGAYLEPDEINGFGYLEALNEAIMEVDNVR